MEETPKRDPAGFVDVSDCSAARGKEPRAGKLGAWYTDPKKHKKILL